MERQCKKILNNYRIINIKHYIGKYFYKLSDHPDRNINTFLFLTSPPNSLKESKTLLIISNIDIKHRELL